MQTLHGFNISINSMVKIRAEKLTNPQEGTCLRIDVSETSQHLVAEHMALEILAEKRP